MLNFSQDGFMERYSDEESTPFDLSPVYGSKIEDLSRGFFEDEFRRHSPGKFSMPIIAVTRNVLQPVK
jgi:hypothetical protein